MKEAGAHVQKEDHGHFPAVPVPVPVDLFIRGNAHFQVGPGFQGRVQVNVFTICQPIGLAHALRHDQLELPADVVRQRGIGLKRFLVEGDVALLHHFFFHDAPAGFVVVGPKVPLVIHVGLGLAGLEFAAAVVVVQQRSVALTRNRLRPMPRSGQCLHHLSADRSCACSQA